MTPPHSDRDHENKEAWQQIFNSDMDRIMRKRPILLTTEDFKKKNKTKKDPFTILAHIRPDMNLR